MSRLPNTPKLQTFLVRAWLEQTDNQTNLWRFRVQNVRTAEWHSFTDLASLTAYLQSSMEKDVSANLDDQSNLDD